MNAHLPNSPILHCSNAPFRILGIDPGTVVCGYGIVEAGTRGKGQGNNLTSGPRKSGPAFVTAGEIKLDRKAPLPERLHRLYDFLGELIREHSPSRLCLEKIFYHKSITSAFALGSTRGIAMLLAAQHGMPVHEYNPTEVKMALTGYGRAEKRQVQEMVKIILNLKSSPQKFSEDSTDALALCICHINSQRSGAVD